MKKIKSAISLALLAVAPAICAQNIDTKAHPDYPTFTVTLTVDDNGDAKLNGDTLKIQKQANPASNGLDSIVPRGSWKSIKVLPGTKAAMGLKADPQMMLESITINNQEAGRTKADETAGVGVIKSYAFNTLENRNYYTIDFGELKQGTDIVVKWVKKPAVTFTASNTQQTVNASSGASGVVVKAVIAGTNTVVTPDVSYVDSKGAAISGVGAITAAGTYYAKFILAEDTNHLALNDSVKLIINEKVTPAAPANLAVTDTLLQGQPLSVATLTGGEVKAGERTISGTWSWVEPNKAVAAGAGDNNKYTAIFTPDSAAVYNTVTADVKVNAKYVATATVKQSVGGTVKIKNASADNRYIGDNLARPKIKATATPDAGYKVVGWSGVTDSDLNSGSEVAVTSDETTLTSDNTVVSAVFEKATREISIESSGNGTVTVTDDKGGNVASGSSVAVGTTLTITATPTDGTSQVKTGSVGYVFTPGQKSTDDLKEYTSFIVGTAAGSYKVKATFEAVKSTEARISVPAVQNGSLLIKEGTTIVAPNSSVEKGKTLSVIALPNRGYKVTTLTANNEDIKVSGVYTIGDVDDVTIQVAFEKETYPVTVSNTDQVTLSVEGGKLEFGSKIENIQATVKDQKNYKLVSLLVNNKPMENGSTITVEGPVSIAAEVQKLTPVTIQNPTEATEVLYSGNKQEYAVKTAAGLGGFNVAYYSDAACKTVAEPINSGTYYVKITREADAVYAYCEEVRTLKINPAVPGIKKIPFSNELNNGTIAGSATVPGTWQNTKPDGREPIATKGFKAAMTTTIYFVPDDPNIGYVEANAVQSDATKKSITMTSNITGGSVVLKNGTIAVTGDTETYVGQTFSLDLIPAAGYYLENIGGVTIGGQAYAKGKTFTLESGGLKSDLDIVVGDNVFKAQNAITLSNKSQTVTRNFNNQVVNIAASELTLGGDNNVKWDIYCKSNGVVVSPVNAGDYDIYVKSAGSEKYAACSETPVGTLKINKLKVKSTDVSVPSASAVLTDASLSTSTLSGGLVKVGDLLVPGQFAWKEEKAVDNAGSYGVTFTPASDNFDVSNLTSLTSYVSLIDVATQTVTFKKAGASGSFVVTDATNVTLDTENPVHVQKGMQLTITPTSGTVESISGVKTTSNNDVNGKPISWICIVESDATITVTFKSGSEGGDPEEGTAVTGISLNKSTLTLPRLKSEKLVATVAPTGATKKDVKWTSTAPAIASVEADGTVKALKVGQATIIATTVDGGFTAMCEVTVDFATALEKILSESHVYGQKGQIVIEPAAPVEATIVDLSGKIVYHSSINNTLRMPACSGVYIVRLSASGTTTTTKVLVH